MMRSIRNEQHTLAATPESLLVEFDEKLQADTTVVLRPRTSSSSRKKERNSWHPRSSDNVKGDSTEDARTAKRSPRPRRNRSAEKSRRRRESDPLPFNTWNDTCGGRRKIKSSGKSPVRRSLDETAVRKQSFEEKDNWHDTWNGSFSVRIERTTTSNRQRNSTLEEGDVSSGSTTASSGSSEREHAKRKEDPHRSSSRSRKPHRKPGEESTRRSPRSSSRGRKKRNEADAHKEEEASSRSKRTSSRSTSRDGRRRTEPEQAQPSSRSPSSKSPSSRSKRASSTNRGRHHRSGSRGRTKISSSNSDPSSKRDGPRVDSSGFQTPERRMRKGSMGPRMSHSEDGPTDRLFDRMAPPEPPNEARSRSRSTSRGRRRNTNEEEGKNPPPPPDSGVLADFPFCTPDRRMRKGMASRISRSEDGPTDKYFYRFSPGAEPRARSRSTSRGRRKNSKDPCKRTSSTEEGCEEDAKQVSEPNKEPLSSIQSKEDKGSQAKLSSMLENDEAKNAKKKESNDSKDACSLVSFDTVANWEYIKTAAKLAVLDAERTHKLAERRDDLLVEETKKPGTKNTKLNLEPSLQILPGISEHSERSGQRSVELSPKAASRRFSRRSSLDSQSMSSSICSGAPKQTKRRFSRRNSLESSIHSIPSTPSPIVEVKRMNSLTMPPPRRESTSNNRKIKYIRKPDKEGRHKAADESKTIAGEAANCKKSSSSERPKSPLLWFQPMG